MPARQPQRKPVKLPPDYNPRKVPLGAPEDFYRLLTINDVGRMLGCHPMTVRSMVTRGDLKVVRVNSSLRFRPEHVQEYIDSRTVG